jgi:hypothetical protein
MNTQISQNSEVSRRRKMIRALLICVVLIGTLSQAVAAQEKQTTTANAACTFQDGKEMSVRYNPALFDKDKEDSFSDRRMFLFTQTPLSIGDKEIPAGAFSLYLMQKGKTWTLIINKNVTPDTKYDEKQDLARVSMQLGEVDSAAKQLEILFAHGAPKQCNLRVYQGHTGAWAEFKETGPNK